MNNRRKLIVALGVGALAAPFGSLAQQQGKVWRVGFLSAWPSNNDQRFEWFRQQLRDLGHVEGKTISIDHLSAEGNYDRLPALAADLVRRNVDVIMTDGGTPAATAARNAARTIPVVFAGVADPVGQGFVTSLARPGGNITGVTNQQPEVAIKLLVLLKELVPSTKRIAILSNPTNSALPNVILDMHAAARKLRLEVVVVNARAPAEFEGAFAEIVRDRPAGLVILSDPLFTSQAERLAILAAKHQLPTVCGNPALPENGGLMSYGGSRPDMVRRAAILVDKILKGAKPADLPVEQPTKFDLVLNMKTAKSLGVKIPNSIMVRADKVIE
jgi:putative ABC transport system substrate-binding protein